MYGHWSFRIVAVLTAILLGLVFALSPVRNQLRAQKEGGLQVLSTLPPNNIVDADPEASIQVEFTAAVDPATVRDSSFRVSGNQTGVYTGTIELMSPTQPQFLANSHFKPGEQVEVTLTSGISSAIGEDLSPPFVWRFLVSPGTPTGKGTGQFLTVPSQDEVWQGYDALLGDFDADGDLDAITEGIEAGYRLWLNDGSGQFANSGKPGPMLAKSELAGDFDADGDLDVITDDLTLWRNDGTGGFSKSQISAPFDSSVRHSGDYDNDGDLDFILSSYPNSRLWLNDGSGGFQPGEETFPPEVDLAFDVDSDNDLDLLARVGYDGERIIAIFLNDGTGHFVRAQEELRVSNSRHQLVGDLDNDGDLDLMLGQQIWLNNGEATFEYLNDLELNMDVPNSPQLGDLDGDGDLDILLTDNGLVILLLNDGEAKFEITATRVSDNVGQARLGDLDGDGDLDVFFSDSDEGKAGAWINRDPIPESDFWIETSVPDPNEVSVDSLVMTEAKFNKPVKADSLHAGSFVVRGSQSALTDHLISAHETMASLVLSEPFKPGEVVEATLTSDITSLDGEALRGHTWQFTVEAITGTGLFEFGYTLGGLSDSNAAIGDVDGDGDIDVVVAECNAFDAEELVPDGLWLNDGQGTLYEGEDLETSCSRDVELGDLDNDGDLDALFVGEYGCQVWLNDSNGDFRRLGEAFGPGGPSGARRIALGDLDSDGDLDAFVATWGTFGNQAWFNTGDGSFVASGQEIFHTCFPCDYRVAALGDIDNDGDLDVIMGGEDNAVWANDGTGYLTLAQSLGDAQQVLDVELADFNQDSNLDALLSGDGPSQLWVNTGGVFDEWFHAPGTSGIGDIDADGDLDLFDGGSSQYTAFTNEGGFQFKLHHTLDFGQGYHEILSTSLADLDGDGDLDAFVANDHNTRNLVFFNITSRHFMPVVVR